MIGHRQTPAVANPGFSEEYNEFHPKHLKCYREVDFILTRICVLQYADSHMCKDTDTQTHFYNIELCCGQIKAAITKQLSKM